MSLLHEKQPSKLCLEKGQQCWQFFDCYKVLCDAHGNTDFECWHIPQTHCHNFIFEDFFEKIAICLSCEYFKQKGRQDPKGYENFIAAQLRNANRKAFERQFQKEESFVETLNRIPDGLFTFDRDWRIDYFNPTAEKITGFHAEDAVGMYCDDVFKIRGPDTSDTIKKIISEGKEVLNREYEIISVEGRKIPIISSTSAFRNGNGEFLGGLEIFKDITDLKRLQEEIAKRERKYRRIFEGSHDMIFTSTLDGSMLDVNQAGVDLLGYPNKKEILQIDGVDKIYRNSQDREKLISLIERDGYIKDFEVDLLRYDGAPIHTLISSRRYENPETGIIEYEGIIKDITRRKQAEEIIQQRNRELSILNSIAVALNFTTRLDRIIELTLDKISKKLPISNGGVFLFEDGLPVLKAGFGLPEPTEATPAQIEFKDSMLMEFLVQKKTELEPEPFFPSFQVKYTAGGKTSQWLTCFLITSKRKTVGFFGFEFINSDVLSIQELHLLGSLGNLLGNAIENARLMETIKQHQHELQGLTQKLFETQEEERRRIARELHDEAGQSLSAVKLGLDRLQEKIPAKNTVLYNDFKEIKNMLGRTSSEIRRLSYNLHPTLLNDLGLEPALKLYFNEIQKHSDLEIDFRMIGFNERLDPDLETALYRISQEALTNTLKHSGAETFKCKIIKSYPKIIFTAEDDGMGFDGRIEDQDKRSLGLIGMRERTLLLGGAFQFRGNPGKGVRIRLEIPLPGGGIR